MLTHHAKRRRLGAASLAAFLAAGTLIATAPAAIADPQPDAQGHLVLIGGAVTPGNDTSEAIMQRIVDLAQEHAGAGNTPIIAVSTVASSVATNPTEAADGHEYDNATANGLYYKEWFEAHGAEVYPIPVDVNPGEDYPGDPYSADHAFDADVAQQVSQADGVYFGGGDQTNYVRALFECTAVDPAAEQIYAYTSCTDTPVMAAIRGVVESGGVSAGTSAGLAIQQGVDMIAGGEPYESWRDGAVPGWFDGADPVNGNTLSYIPAGGLGFFTEGTLDSHFARRDRQPRVVRLAIQLGHDRAFGVEEKTALVVDRAQRRGEVIGDLGATLLDVSEATSDGTNVAGINYSYFTSGSTIDFVTGEISLAGAVHQGAGTGPAPAAEEDIWKSYECDSDPYIFGALTLAQTFVQSGEMRSDGLSCDAEVEQPRFKTTYNRTAATEWGDDGSFVDLDMSITELSGFEITDAVLNEVPGADEATSAALGADGVDGAERAGNTGAFKAGSQVELTVTVTNTGGTPLAGLQLGAGAPAAGVLAPGESLEVSERYTVVEGPQTIDVGVGATAVDAQGAVLNIDTDVQSWSVSFTGTTADGDANTGDEETPAQNEGDNSGVTEGDSTSTATAHNGAKAGGALVNTGAPDSTPLVVLGALLLAAAGAVWARARRVAKRS